MTGFDVLLIIGIQFATILALLLPPYLFWLRPKIRWPVRDLIFVAIIVIARRQFEWHFFDLVDRFSMFRPVLAGYMTSVFLIAIILGLPQYLLWRHLKRKEQNTP